MFTDKMDLLKQFDRDAHDFWVAWTVLDPAEQASLKGTHLFHQTFQTAFNIKQALQKHLMTGPPGHRVYCKRELAEHVICCSDSESE